MARGKRQFDSFGKAQRGAQLLKANRRRGLGKQRGMNEPTGRFISSNDRPAVKQGTRR